MGRHVDCQVFIVLPPIVLPRSSGSFPPVENGSDGDDRSLGDGRYQSTEALFQEWFDICAGGLKSVECCRFAEGTLHDLVTLY